MKKTLLIISVLILVFTSCKKEKTIVEVHGCTDSIANNYNPLANVDDGSCIYEGCTDSIASNYCSYCTIDDGSCIYNLQNVTINFTQTVDGVDLTTNTMIYNNPLGENYDIQTLKYLISDLSLHADDGSITLIDEVHFVDVSNTSTLNCSFMVLVNPGHYTSISYTMGLDTIKNKNNLYVNEDFHSTMAWPVPMGGGYHYMKLEGAYINDSTFYNTHTGGTMGEDYSFNNSSSISLNVDDNMGNINIVLNMEINNWYRTPNTISFAGAIMMDMMKQMQLKQNGMTDVFSVTASQ